MDAEAALERIRLNILLARDCASREEHKQTQWYLCAALAAAVPFVPGSQGLVESLAEQTPEFTGPLN